VSEQRPVSGEGEEDRADDGTERPAAEVLAQEDQSDAEGDTEEPGPVKDEGLSTLEGEIEDVKQRAREMTPEGDNS
jgi:hypothetical protein